MTDRKAGYQEEEESVGIPALDLAGLKFMCLLGRGAKGAVFRVRSTGSDEDLALKVVLKASYGSKSGGKPEKKSKIGRIWFEREILSGLRHPLLPTLRGFVETEAVVGCAIDYCPGRDLNSVRRQQSEKMFSDDIIRFYGAELVLALEYLHKLGIVYRDLKPENVLIQENGHLMLVDFDLSTKLTPRSAKSPVIVKKKKPEPPKKSRRPMLLPCFNSGVSPEYSVSTAGNSDDSPESESVAKSNSFVGTEDYVAPEIIAGNGHDFAVDWWCLGVVLYEMLYGTTPFRGANRKETFCRVLSKAPDLVGETTPLRDLIGRLLEKDPVKRIQLEEIKGHDFFRGVDWEMIWRIGRPPFIPALTEWEQDVEGIMGIDVENIVQEIFSGKNNEEGGNGDVDNDVKIRENEGNLISDCGDRENENNKRVFGVEADNFFVF